MSSPGRVAVAVSNKLDDADKAVLAEVEKRHRDGKRDLCTARQLRDNVPGVGEKRVPAALERLVHVGKLHEVQVERIEGGKPKKRWILRTDCRRAGG